jgi:hypothetical protein
MTMTPSAVTRVPPSATRRSFTGSGSEDRRTSKRRWMALATLLTFWPPAPCARTAVHSTSSGRIDSIG